MIYEMEYAWQSHCIGSVCGIFCVCVGEGEGGYALGDVRAR